MTTVPEPSTTSPTDTSARRSRAIFFLFLLVLAAGAGLRVWYVSGELHINRFEDERYSLRNVRKILATWDFEPASAYYPSPVFNLPQVLALKASQGLSESFDVPALAIRDARGELSPTAFLLTRLYQTLCGVLTLWLVFLVGRRLASPAAGLFAATVLAFMPWMIHASGYNKPDALLVMAVLLSLHAALRAVDATRPWPAARRALRRTVALWAWAGVCVALAMSAKITGGFAAIPLTVGALLAPGDRALRLRRFGLLVLAGVSSAVAFVLMNPYWRAYFYFLRGLQRDYAGRTEASRWEIPWKVASMHLERFFLGPVLGTLALLAFAGCGVLLLRRWRRARGAGPTLGPTSTQLAMLLAYPLLYAAAYAVQTPYFKPNNFLPTIPFTVLALAIWLDAALRAVDARWPDRRSVVAAAATAVAVLALVLPGAWRYVFHSRVPTTLDVVVAQLNHHLEPPSGHVVFMERWTPPPIPWDGTRGLHKGLSTVVQRDDLGELPQEVLDLAAAIILVKPADGDSDSLAATWPTSLRWTVEPIPFRYRGPVLEVVLRAADRRSTNLVAAACGPGCLQAELPDGMQDEVMSVFTLLPRGVEEPKLVLGGRQVALYRTSTQRHGVLFASPRFRLPVGLEELRIVEDSGRDPGESVDEVQIELHRWEPSPDRQPPPELRR